MNAGGQINSLTVAGSSGLAAACLPRMRVPDGTPGLSRPLDRSGTPFALQSGNAPICQSINDLSNDSAKRLPTDRRVVVFHSNEAMEELKQCIGSQYTEKTCMTKDGKTPR